MIDYDPLSPTVRADAYPYYAKLRETPGFVHVKSLDAWAIPRYADVKEVARNHGAFSSDILIDIAFGPFNPAPEARYMIASDPPDHTRLRTLVMKAFTAQVVYKLEPRIRELANELIDEMRESGERVDLVEKFAGPLPMTILADLLGVEPSMHASFRRWSNQTTIGIDQELTEERRKQLEADTKEFRDYLENVIAERRKQPRDDLFSRLILAEESESRLSPEEVLAFTVLLIIAGNETTTNTLGNTILLLAQNPDQMSAVREDPKLLDGAVDESLRYYSPVQILFRRVTKDFEVAGHRFREGERVIPMFASANRDEAMFPDPDRFDVRRDSRAHLAFGFGIHRCMGSLLGHFESMVAMQELLRRIPEFEIDESGLSWLDSFYLKGPKSLPASVRIQ